MRLLHVMPSYLPAARYGGPIHAVHALCAALARRGHEVDVYTTSIDGASDSDVPHDEPVELDGVRVRYFRSRALRRLYWAPSLRRALAGAIAQYDVAHLHSVFLWPTAAAASLARAASVPYVVSPRGMLAPDPIRARNELLKRAWIGWVESASLAGASAVHLTSRLELAQLRRLALPVPAPFVLPNGVEPPAPGHADRASLEVRGMAARPYALFLGRLGWIKGLDRLLEALAGTEIELVVCGPDDEGLRAGLDRYARELGVAGQVRFLAAVAGDDKWTLLANARLVVLPSLHESFGNVIVEALSVGRPVVTTETVGAAEIVRGAEAGLVCGGDAAALRTAMQRLWDERELAERMGKAGERYARERLGWDGIAARMAERYEKLVPRARATGR